MSKFCIRLSLIAVLIATGFAFSSFSQTKLLKRTTFKSDLVRSGAGGTFSIIGSPAGSITLEGWNKNDVEITAEITVEAASESDLAELAAVVGFLTDPGMNHTRIISVGPHDRKYLKSVNKKFPKRLVGMPYRIDYKIKVPAFTDLEIDGGAGDLSISNIEGTMRIKYLETNADLNLVGGTISASFGKGNVDVSIPVTSWRGRTVEIQLVQGDLNIALSESLSAEIEAQVLRSGEIKGAFEQWEKQGRADFSSKLINAKAGGGGARLGFVVGDGTMTFSSISKQSKP